MRKLVFFVFFVFSFACSLQKKLDKGKYQAIIQKLGKNSAKNSANENWMVAEAYRKANQIQEATPFYQQYLSQSQENEIANIHLSNALKANEKYAEAKQVLDKYLSYSKNDSIKKRASKEIENLKLLTDLKENPSFYTVKNLEDLNTKEAEYSPVYRNGSLYFVSNRNEERIYQTTGTPFSSIYHVKTKGAKVKMESLLKLPSEINSPNTNDGSLTLFPDASAIIFAKGNTGKSNDFSEVNLFFARFRNGSWSKAVSLGTNLPESWDSSPALSPDGKTLYFASNRAGGYGGTDIYSAKMNRRGLWVDVRNLGPSINTSGNEAFPFVSRDGSLYFASDGHPGFGRLDIFKATRSKGEVTVVNLGKPMNSPADDFGLNEFNFTRGFFSSNRKGGKGDDDIYTYVNNDHNLKIVNYYLTVTTVTTDDSGSEIILPNTKISMKTKGNELVDEAFTASNGKFKFRVYPEENYDLIGEKIDYFTTRKAFTTEGKTVDKTKLKEVETNIEFETKIMMERIVLEKTILLNNIYYDLDKANIRADARPILDSLTQIMRDNPEIYIELGSHTDSRSDDNYNLDLSQRRAQSAVRYIIDQGIKSSRITARGYGESQLLIKEAKTEEEHQQNRRTEFKVLKYSPTYKEETPPVKTGEKDEYDRFFTDDEE